MNKFIDVTYFDDVLLEVQEEFIIFHKVNVIINDYGEYINQYEQSKIYGSMQPQAVSKTKINKASAVNSIYNFYCGSQYRVYVDDIIQRSNGECFIVTLYKDYDIAGVRTIECQSISLSAIRDLNEFKAYEDKEKTK